MDASLDETISSNDQKRRASDFSPEIAARKYLELLKLL
jgi:hypothetical protein